MTRRWVRIARGLLIAAAVLASALPAPARVLESEPEARDFDGLQRQFRVGPYAPARGGTGINGTNDVPDIFGPGAVLNVGNIFMKCTNYGLDGNPFTNLSTDPSGQWRMDPGQTEYLNYIGFAVGAVNPLASDPTAMRRVSYITEWRPPTLDLEDRMYRSYDGIVDGQRYINDDKDFDPTTLEERIDEDFLDGRDNDGDGRIDEDFGAIGQQMYTCVMRDDTPQAINAAAAERHVPLGIELRKSCWAYSIPGYLDFNVIRYDIYNRSGHTLDSVVIGWRTDMDCGPATQSNYWADDYNMPQYPHGDFIIQTKSDDLRRQDGTIKADGSPNLDPHVASGWNPDSALCPRFKVRIMGWSTVDDNGDENKTTGIGSVLLVDHSIDPLGLNGPTHVGLTTFRSFPGGTPYASGGSPTIDQQRYEMMTSTDPVSTNIDPATGFLNAEVTTGDQKSDYSEWASIGPWANWADGAHLTATIAFTVGEGNFALASGYSSDYASAVDDAAGGVVEVSARGRTLIQKYPNLENALAAQVAFTGVDELPGAWPQEWLNDFHGRETGLKAPRGQSYVVTSPCERESEQKTITDNKYTWFDFDCDYCTGSYSPNRSKGNFHRSWLAEAPPPSPNTNLSSTYNYTDNPYRRIIAAGDRVVNLAWDNLSETTVDPKSGQFDFRGYRVWKVSDWRRPVGSGGPVEEDWTLLADFRLFDARDSNIVRAVCPPESVAAGACNAGEPLWPLVYVPATGRSVRLKLRKGDLWNAQTGEVLRPETSPNLAPCRKDELGHCKTSKGRQLGHAEIEVVDTMYSVGRYHMVDREVKNGFIYFYSVTAYDSTGRGSSMSMLSSRRAAVEAEGVVPQGAAGDVGGPGKGVWVVPNPYRGVRSISSRPSAWDLTPNATDPTGTHVDFMGLPRGEWSIKIYTVSGDLVQTLKSSDSVNESIRPVVTDEAGVKRPGYNRQADSSNDGQARWNLISRNGQDIVSGIYLFTVETGGSVRHRGKFVIIR